MTDKNKIIALAQKYVAKNQWDKAIRELQKLVAEDPRDIRTLFKLGDVYDKKGDRENATRIYRQVAEAYSDQGFFMKAVAVYKKILKHDSKNLEVTLKLAELYEHLGLSSEAMAQYQIVAQIHEENGNAKQSLEVLRRMVEFDADNVPSRIKLAENYSKEQMLDEATAQFEKAAEILKKQNRIDEYIKVAERLIYHDPGRASVLKELAKLYLNRQEYKRGVAKLQLCYKSDPKDTETLQLLADGLEHLDQAGKAVTVLKQLVQVLNERKQSELAKSVYVKILRLDPSDADALKHTSESKKTSPERTGQEFAMRERPSLVVETPLAPQKQMDPFAETEHTDAGSILRTTPPPPAVVLDKAVKRAPSLAPRPKPAESAKASAARPPATPPTQQAISETAAASDVIEIEVDEGLVVHKPAAAPPKTPPPRARPKPDKAARIAEILTESDVYIKYNLHQKALEHLRSAFELDPDCEQAFKKIRDVYVALGDKNRAAETVSNLIQLYQRQGRTQEADEARGQLQTLSPGHPPVQNNQPGHAAASNEQVVIEFADDADELFSDAEVSISETEEPDVSIVKTGSNDADFEFDFSQGSSMPVDGFVAEDDILSEESAFEAPAQQPFELPEDEPSFAGEALAEEQAIDDEALIIADAHATHLHQGESQDELDEVEFLMDAGLFNEAREALDSVLSRLPNSARALHLQTALQANAQSPQASNTEAVDTPFADFDDEELGAALIQPAAANEASDSGNPEDAYDQGMALKEIGRLDDAIQEFLTAARSQTRAVSALEMIGHCYLEKNAPERAVEYFQSALEAEKTGAAAINLKYELALAYELAGQKTAAAEWYQACFNDDPKHRDVAARLADLGLSLDDVTDVRSPTQAHRGGTHGSVEPSTDQKKSKISYL